MLENPVFRQNVMDYLTISPAKKEGKERAGLRREKKFICERLRLGRSNK